MEGSGKKIDESWKENVRKEKEMFEAGGAPDIPEAQAGFAAFLSTLGMQTLLALGEAANPATGQKTVDLAGARYLIDVLQVLSEKTHGNLTPEEDTLLKSLIYELQMKFVQKTQSGSHPHAD